MTLALALEVAGTLVGLAYLWWEYHADKRVWLAGIAMPALSLWVYWQAGLYADFGINVYYLLAALYGLWAWRKPAPNGSEPPVTAMPRRLWAPLAIATSLIFIALAALLHHTPSTVPWWDAATTALSIAALWMLAHKWTQQWLVWIAVDILSAVLYAYKGLPFYAVLYSVYTIVAIAGYLRWKFLATLSAT